MKIDRHANKVVAGFKKSLSKEQVTALGSESFEELHILVEAALGATAQNVLHDISKELESLAKQTRKKAHTIEGLDH